MEIKSARILDDDQPKSIVEVEKELLQQHEAEKLAREAEPPKEVEPPELADDVVLSYINKKFQKGYNSFDELWTPQVIEKEVELPEDVALFHKFKKETRRGLEDYMKLQRDLAKENPDTLLAEYISATNPEYDAEDVAHEMKRFAYDETLDDEDVISDRKRAKKKELSKALAHFESQKEKYKMPTESVASNIPDSDKEGYESYKKEVSTREQQVQKNQQIRDAFVQKTNELFTNDFKGFDFSVGDKSFTYTPNEAEKLKQAQVDVANFINSHFSEDGVLKDAKAYHKALAVAMNADAFAKHFYEQGKADAVSQQAIDSKNIDMGRVRAIHEVIKTGSITARDLSASDGDSLKIPSKTRR